MQKEPRYHEPWQSRLKPGDMVHVRTNSRGVVRGTFVEAQLSKPHVRLLREDDAPHVCRVRWRNLVQR